MNELKLQVGIDKGHLESQIDKVLGKFENIKANVKSTGGGGAMATGASAGVAAGALMKLVDMVAGIVTNLAPITALLQILTTAITVALLPSAITLFRSAMPLMKILLGLAALQYKFYKAPEEVFKKAFTKIFKIDDELYDIIDKKIPLLEAADIIATMITIPLNPGMIIKKMFGAKDWDLWKYIKQKISDAWKSAVDIGAYIYDKAKGYLSDSLDVLKGLGTKLYNIMIDVLNFVIDQINKVPGINMSHREHAETPSAPAAASYPYSDLYANRGETDVEYMRRSYGYGQNSSTINLNVSGLVTDDAVNQIKNTLAESQNRY